MSKAASIESKIKELQKQLKQAKLDEEKEAIDKVVKLITKHSLQLLPLNDLDVALGKIAAKQQQQPQQPQQAT